jgi:hypothetical protein
MNRILQVFLALLAVFIVALAVNNVQADMNAASPMAGMNSAMADDFGVIIQNNQTSTAQFDQAANKENQARLDSAMIESSGDTQANMPVCSTVRANSGYKLLMNIQHRSAGFDDQFDLTSRAMTRNDEIPVNLRSLLKCPIFAEAPISGMNLIAATVPVNNKDSPVRVFSSNLIA